MAETVRIATKADEPEIIRLLHLMHAEGGMLPLDLGRAREMFAQAFDRKGGIMGVIGGPGNIKAMIYLFMSKYWYTNADHLEEVFNFVSPEHRKAGYGKDLIVFAKECADKICVPLVIGVLTNQRMEEKVRLYRRVLGTPCGAFFVYGANFANLELSNNKFWKDILERQPKPKSANGSASATHRADA